MERFREIYRSTARMDYRNLSSFGMYDSIFVAVLRKLYEICISAVHHGHDILFDNV